MVTEYPVLMNLYDGSGITPACSIDMSESPCVRSWPWCTQPLYAGALATAINITLISSLGAHSSIERPPVWEASTPSEGERVVVDCR